MGLIVALLLITMLAGTRIAQAHANLVRSEPRAGQVLVAAPDTIRLLFSEAPEPRFSQIEVLDRTGQAVKGVGPVRLDPDNDKQLDASLEPLPPGLYTVAWRALSAVDGHVTAGAFAFAIGSDQVPAGGFQAAASGASAGTSSGPTLPGVLTRWLGYLSMALIVGGFAFVPLVLQPALEAAGKQRGRQPRSPASAGQTAPFSHASGLFRVLVGGWALLLITTLAGALVQAATSANVDLVAALNGPLLTLLSGTRYGTIFWLRLAAVLAIGGLLGLRQSRWWRRDWTARWWWAGAATGFIVLLTTSLNSHAAAAPEALPAVSADVLHLLAASLWIGGLVALLLALVWLRRTEGASAALPISRLVGRFSQLASVSLVLLGLSGVYRALVEIGDAANLIDTPYGTTLLIKLALLVPLLALGALNLTLISRRLAKAAATNNENLLRSPYQMIRRTVSGEVVLVSAILLVTGILTSLPPSRDAFGAGFVVRGTTSDLRLVVAVNPAQAGLNTFTVYLKDGLGRPVADAQKVALIFTMLEHDMGKDEEVATSQGDGRYIVQSDYLSMLGTWQMELLVRRAGQDDVRTAFVLPFGDLPRQRTAAPVSDYPLRAFLGLEVVAGGVALLVWASRSRRSRRFAFVAGATVCLGGFALVLTGAINMRAQMSSLQNPIPPNLESLARGRVIYDANCAQCHGPLGLGDGPDAAALQPPPANLQVHMAAGHPDDQLFAWISNGIDGTAMPAFANRLSENERWDVINYIRSFAELAK